MNEEVNPGCPCKAGTLTLTLPNPSGSLLSTTIPPRKMHYNS